MKWFPVDVFNLHRKPENGFQVQPFVALTIFTICVEEEVVGVPVGIVTQWMPCCLRGGSGKAFKYFIYRRKRFIYHRCIWLAMTRQLFPLANRLFFGNGNSPAVWGWAKEWVNVSEFLFSFDKSRVVSPRTTFNTFVVLCFEEQWCDKIPLMNLSLFPVPCRQWHLFLFELSECGDFGCQ